MPKKASKQEDDRRLYDPKRFIKLSEVPNFERLATGVAAIDIYTCGGFPKGTTILLSGPEKSGKTNVAILGMAGFQRQHPKETVLYVNVDNKLDPPWVSRLGADTSRMDVFGPGSADEAHDIIYHVCEKRMDVGFVLVDSLAALSPEAEVIGNQEMGVAAALNNKFFRKMTTLQLTRMRKGHPLTLCIINQERVKVGGLFPVPIIPGGMQQKFQAALWIKFLKADLHIDKPTGLPIAISMRYVFNKNTGGADGYPGETRMATTPHGKWLPGNIIDQEFAWLWGRRFGLFKGEHRDPLILSWEDDARAYTAAKLQVQAAFQQWINGKQKANFIKEENLVTVGGENSEVELAVS